MDISVVIVNYNVQYFLEQCILSVQSASEKLKVEIIVVDNNSKDASCKLISEKYTEVILIKNKENVGFSKANNQAVKIAKGEYVLILNPDTVVAEDTLTQIFEYAKSKQNLGILGVKLIDGAGKFLPESKRGLPTPRVSFNKLFGISGRKTGKYYATHLGENETGIVAILVGAFMLLKRKVYNEVNGFDEAYFMYGEDIDLSCKTLNKGYQNYYYANTQVIHYKGESTKNDIQNLKYFHKAMKIFYKKHFKLNYIYDFIMSFGIEFWFLIKYFKFLKPKNIFKESFTVMYLEKKLVDDFKQIKNLIKKNGIDTIVFDNLFISNKKIISHFQELKNEKVIFKIHPKNTNFLIGSNNSLNLEKVDFIEGN